jgi:hypothetical protein
LQKTIFKNIGEAGGIYMLTVSKVKLQPSIKEMIDGEWQNILYDTECIFLFLVHIFLLVRKNVQGSVVYGQW